MDRSTFCKQLTNPFRGTAGGEVPPTLAPPVCRFFLSTFTRHRPSPGCLVAGIGFLAGGAVFKTLRGRAVWSARQAHNLEVAGSNPAPATASLAIAHQRPGKVVSGLIPLGSPAGPLACLVV